MMDQDIIGIIAATLTTVSFLPQTIKVVRTRHTYDISLSMYIIFSIGVCFWLIYGILLGKYPIIVANIITLCFCLVILWVKLRNG